MPLVQRIPTWSCSLLMLLPCWVMSTPSWLSFVEDRSSLLLSRNTLSSVVLKYPWRANIYLGKSLPNSCRMLGNLAKLANLWVTLHSDPLTQGTTVLATRSIIIKGLTEIFYGKIPQKEKASDQWKEIVDQLLAIRDSVSDFPTFLPRLLSYLHDCCHNFKAGRVTVHFAAWKDLTNDRVILSDLLGASIELSATPSRHRVPGHAFDEYKYYVVHQEIQKLL